MPRYDYFCDANGRTVEVCHGVKTGLKTWGEVCYAAQIPLAETHPAEPVRRLIRPVGISIPLGNSRLKEHGFTKLVKRDDGVYENVTAIGAEQRYMKAGDKASLPHLHKKISS